MYSISVSYLEVWTKNNKMISRLLFNFCLLKFLSFQWWFVSDRLNKLIYMVLLKILRLCLLLIDFQHAGRRHNLEMIFLSEICMIHNINNHRFSWKSSNRECHFSRSNIHYSCQISKDSILLACIFTLKMDICWIIT